MYADTHARTHVRTHARTHARTHVHWHKHSHNDLHSHTCIFIFRLCNAFQIHKANSPLHAYRRILHGWAVDQNFIFAGRTRPQGTSFPRKADKQIAGDIRLDASHKQTHVRRCPVSGLRLSGTRRKVHKQSQLGRCHKTLAVNLVAWSTSVWARVHCLE